MTGDQSVYKYEVIQENVNSNHSMQCARFWFGSDKYGRDVMSRIFIGIRYTLFIGVASVILSLFIGLFLGCLAGYFGHRTDQIIFMSPTPHRGISHFHLSSMMRR